MISILIESPNEMGAYLAKQVRDLRLSINMSQQTLSERSGVSYGVIKKFERTGKISLESLLKIALILDCLENFTTLFSKAEHPKSLDDLIGEKPRKRGRK